MATMDAIYDALLTAVPGGWRGRQLYIGTRWTLAVVENTTGQQRAGLASTFASDTDVRRSSFAWGENQLEKSAADYLHYVKSRNPAETAVGMATLNALLRPPLATLGEIDAADWLSDHSPEQRVAIIGRFPFIEEELRPFAKRLWVFELKPQAGEFGAAEMPTILPQADLVAITSSTFLNHTLGSILACIRPETRVMLLGPTTPLSAVLFDFGVNLLSGVLVEDIDATLSSVAQSTSFSHMQGVRRVTMGGADWSL